MSSILPDLLQAFADHGLTVRAEGGEARTNDPDGQFAKAFRADGSRLRGGAGLAFGEVLFLEHLVAQLRGQCLVIGNGFGWSSVALGMLLHGRGRVLALDACVDGDEADQGLAVVNAIAAERHLPLRALRGTSPQDVPTLVERECGGRLDLVLIDGLHSEEQQALDFAAVQPFLTDEAVVLFHDVVNWRLDAGFLSIAARAGRAAALLHRTASGMAILYPSSAPYARLVDAFGGEPPVRQPGVAVWARRYEGLARAYLWRGDLATCDKYFALALRETDDPARLWLSRAWLHFDRAEWNACRAALDASAAVDGDAAAPRYWQALVERAMGGSPPRVWERFAHAMRGHGVTAEMKMDAGFAAFTVGEWAQADSLALDASGERPDWSLPWHLRALCARAQGAAAGDVAALLACAVARAPMTAELAYDTACAARAVGRPAEACLHARVAVSLRPDWPEAQALVSALTGASAEVPA